VDFTDGCCIYPAIAKELQGLEIGILGKRGKAHLSTSFKKYIWVRYS